MRPSPASGLKIEWVGRDVGWDFPAHPLPSLAPCWFICPTPTSSHARCSQTSLPLFPQLGCHVLLHWATLVEPSKSVLVFPGQRVQKF